MTDDEAYIPVTMMVTEMLASVTVGHHFIQDMMMTMGTSVMMDNEAIIVMIHNMMRVITLMAITHRAHPGMTIHIRRATDHHHIIHRLGPDDLLDRQ